MPGFKLWAMQPFHVDRIRLTSSMRPEEIMIWMRGESGPGRFFDRMAPLREDHTDGMGRFRTRPNINYRNSFLPVVLIRVARVHEGSEVMLTFRMQRVIQWFCAFWLLIPSALSVVVLLSALHGSVSAPALIPVFMVVFMLLLTGSGYRSERDRTLDFLRRHLEK